MLNDSNKKVAFVLTWMTLVPGTFACLISFILFIILIYHLYYNRIKRDDKVTLFICAYIYLFMLIYIITTVSMNIRTILGDLYGQSFNSSACLFSGYMALVSVSVMYMTFVNQAFYRLVRIVYLQHRWLQSLRLYIILPIIELISACGLMCPIILWNGVVYLENDSYCYASFTNIPGILWAAFVTYLIPFGCLLMIYIRITIFIRQQANNQTILVKKRQHRDFLVIQRIFLIVSFLLMLGLPGMFFIIWFLITGDDLPLATRISWLPVGISLVGLNVALILFIPQLRRLGLKLLKPNRVTPPRNAFPATIQIRIIVATNRFSVVDNNNSTL